MSEARVNKMIDRLLSLPSNAQTWAFDAEALQQEIHVILQEVPEEIKQHKAIQGLVELSELGQYTPSVDMPVSAKTALMALIMTRAQSTLTAGKHEEAFAVADAFIQNALND